MSKQKSAIEKEYLIKKYLDNQDNVSNDEFCDAIGVTKQSFIKWKEIYKNEGIEGLYRGKDKPSILD